MSWPKATQLLSGEAVFWTLEDSFPEMSHSIWHRRHWVENPEAHGLKNSGDFPELELWTRECVKPGELIPRALCALSSSLQTLGMKHFSDTAWLSSMGWHGVVDGTSGLALSPPPYTNLANHYAILSPSVFLFGKWKGWNKQYFPKHILQNTCPKRYSTIKEFAITPLSTAEQVSFPGQKMIQLCLA